MALTKAVQSSLFPTQVVSAGTVVAGTPFTCPTNFASAFYIDFAPVSTQATPTATEWRIESSQLDDNTIWTPIYSRLSVNDVPQSPPNVTVATTGTKAVTLSSGSGFAAGQVVFFQNGTILNSEWGELATFSGSSGTLIDNLLLTQTGTANIWNQCLRSSIELPLTARVRYRFVVNNNRGTNRDVVFRCNHTTLNTVT